MTPAEDTLRQLAALGFKDIKVVGQREDRILYAHSNGDPVVDAPVARVRAGRVILKPWMTRDR